MQMAVSNSAKTGAFTWRSSVATATGNVRTHNEDAVLEVPASGLWVVADGMGGHKAGDVASGMIVKALEGVRPHSRPSTLVDEVEDRLSEVNARLHRASLENKGGMSGSTVAAMLAIGRHVICLWAGDSRIYRSREGVLTQLTRDHSETQELLDEGLITPETAAQREMSNVITRAVGGMAELYLDIQIGELRHNDRYLLCSDGLYRELNDEALVRSLNGNDPARMCSGLIKQALAGPCRDNVSAVVVHFSAV
jgi:serine/threonine protein phosphatase PrpC